MDFKGRKQPDARHLDGVKVTTLESGIAIANYNGLMREWWYVFVTPSIARKIAAELVRLADEEDMRDGLRDD